MPPAVRGQARDDEGLMAGNSPPTIFSPTRRLAARRRMRALQTRPNAPRYLIDDMVEDVIERLAFLRHAPAAALVIGDSTGDLAKRLEANGCAVTRAAPEEDFDEEAPFPFGGFDLVACGALGAGIVGHQRLESPCGNRQQGREAGRQSGQGFHSTESIKHPEIASKSIMAAAERAA